MPSTSCNLYSAPTGLTNGVLKVPILHTLALTGVLGLPRQSARAVQEKGETLKRYNAVTADVFARWRLPV
jgi:hypothetical protein